MLPPVRALVLRLRKRRLRKQRDAVLAALGVLERFVREKELLTNPFEPSFGICKALAVLLRKIEANLSEAAKREIAEAAEKAIGEEKEVEEAEASTAAAAAAAAAATSKKAKGGTGSSAHAKEVAEALEGWLQQVDLAPFARHRKRHRVSHIVLPALLDGAASLLRSDCDETDLSGRDPANGADGAGALPSEPVVPPSADTPASSPASSSTASASDIEEEELVLLDLLHAPSGSFLYHLADVMTRIENLSHVLAWAKFDQAAHLLDPTALSHSDLLVVTLPRLKLTFQARRVGMAVRLFSVDHADLYITNERNQMTTELLAGMPHSLLLSNSNGELSVLVPTVPPCRPNIALVPFSTELVLNRADTSWYAAAESEQCRHSTDRAWVGWCWPRRPCPHTAHDPSPHPTPP